MAEPVQVGEYRRRASDAFRRQSGFGRMPESATRVISSGVSAIGNSIRTTGMHKLLCASALGCLGSRCIVVGEKGILAQSLITAAVMAGHPELTAAVLLGSILGLATRSDTLYELPRFLMYIAFLHLALAVSRRLCRRRDMKQVNLAAGSGFVCAFGFMVVPQLVNGSGMAALPVSVAVAGLVVAVALLSWQGLVTLFKVLDGDIGIDSLIGTGSREARYVLALSMIAIGGLDGISIGAVHVSHILGSTIVLIAGLCYGAATGSLIGSVAGLGISISQASHLSVMIIYSVAGMATGLLRRRNPVAALILGTVTGSAACSVLYERFSGEPTLSLAIGAGLAYAACTWIPQFSEASVVEGDNVVFEGTLPQIESAKERLRSLAGVFGALAQTVASASDVCGSYKSTGFDLLLQEIHQRVCSTCGTHNRCWEKRFYATYDMFLTLFAELEVRSLESVGHGRSYREVPTYLREGCINSRRAVREALDILEEQRERLQTSDRIPDTKQIISTQFRGLAEVVDRMVEEICANERYGAGEQLHRSTASRVQSVEVGIYRAAGSTSAVSGDSRLVYDLGNDRTLIILGDGMGTGERAAVESRFATATVKELIVAGMSHTAAIETVNSIMLMRRNDESFSTLDMAMIDTSRQRVEFTKMGSWPSYLKRGKTVERISSPALPIGIVPGLDVETVVRAIHSGDVVVMASDGVLGYNSDMDKVDRWIMNYLMSTSITCPRELVNALADDIRSALHVIWDDDVTLIAAKVL